MSHIGEPVNDISEFYVRSDPDFEYSEPPLVVHDRCDTVVCTIEAGDMLSTLVRVAQDHECGSDPA